MKRLGIVLVYLILVFLVAALIAPWVWHAVRGMAAGSESAFWTGLTRHPFPRYLNRCLLVVALAGLVPVARALGIRSWRDAGLAGRGRALRDWGRGLLLSAVMFGIVVGAEIATGLRSVRPELRMDRVPVEAGKAGASGVVVGVIEEVLFRGILCGGLQPALGWTGAGMVSSVVYATVHFLERPARTEDVRWWSGLDAVRRMFSGFTRPGGGLQPRFLTLVMAGLVLSQAYRVSGSLYLAMGLHGGWVFWIKLRGWGTIAGSDRAVSGSVSEWLWLGVVAAAYFWLRFAGDRGAGAGRKGSE